MNSVNLVGRLVRDPESRTIQGSGTLVASFSIAIDRDFTKKDGSKDTDFIPVEIMGKPAEFVVNYLGKGRLVAVTGSIRVDNYQTQSGEQKTFTKVAARHVEALDSNKDKGNNSSSEPKRSGREFQDFQAVNDDDIPF